MSRFTERDEAFMRVALALAEQAGAQAEVPVGAVLVQDEQIIGRGFNQCIATHDPTAHAEVVALREAGARLGNYRLPQTTLYVSLEPCLQCVGAMVQARIAHLVFAAADPKAGAVISQHAALALPFLNHRVSYQGGLLAQEGAQLLQAFFRARR